MLFCDLALLSRTRTNSNYKNLKNVDKKNITATFSFPNVKEPAWVALVLSAKL
jgi:hypothetical protein